MTSKKYILVTKKCVKTIYHIVLRFSIQSTEKGKTKIKARILRSARNDNGARISTTSVCTGLAMTDTGCESKKPEYFPHLGQDCGQPWKRTDGPGLCGECFQGSHTRSRGLRSVFRRFSSVFKPIGKQELPDFK